MSFAMKDYTAGQLNAMIKKMKEQFGEDAPMMFLRDKLELISANILRLPTVNEHDFSKCFRRRRSAVRKGECFDFRMDPDIALSPETIDFNREFHIGGCYELKPASSVTSGLSLREMAMGILNVVDEDIANEDLQYLLIKYGHTVEMKQIDRQLTENPSLTSDENTTIWFTRKVYGDNSILAVESGPLNQLNQCELVFWDFDAGISDQVFDPGVKAVSRYSGN